MKVLSLFDGISVGRQALKVAGIPVSSYIASEIDVNCKKVSKLNHPDIWQCGDVSNFDSSIQIDLLLAGSPCQGFSRGGYGLGFEDDRSKLYFEFLRIKNKLKPKYFLLENTLMHFEYQRRITSDLNVSPILINSSNFSAQNRERLYWTNIPIKPFVDKNIKLSSIVGSHDGVWTIPRGFNKGGLKNNGKSPCLTTSCWQHNFFIVRNGIKERFSSQHAEQLQTLPMNYTNCLSENQRFKVLGNSWTCNVIAHILSGLK